MSFKLSGLNALPYLGVQATTPPQLLYIPRAPTKNDYININVGTLWLYVGQPHNTPIELWMMVTAVPSDVNKWVLLYPTSSSGAEEFTTDNGTATPTLGILQVFGDKKTIKTSAQIASNEVDVTMINGSNGQIIIGGGMQPLWGDLTSTGSSIVITEGPNTLNVDVSGAFAQIFHTDSGTVIPFAGVVDVLGGTGITTSGSGNVITIDASGGSVGVITTYYGFAGHPNSTPGLYTWTKNASTQYVTVYVWGPGGGGGSGSIGVAGVAASGGGGGAGGCLKYAGPAFTFGATEIVVVGTGLSGGAAVTTNDTSGNPGGASPPGSFSSFGNVLMPNGLSGGGGSRTGVGGVPGSGNVISADMSLGYSGTALHNTDGGRGVSNSAGVASTDLGMIGNGVDFNAYTGGTGGGSGAGTSALTAYIGGSSGGYLGFILAEPYIISPTLGGIETGVIDGVNGTDLVMSGGVLTGGTGGSGGGAQSTGPRAGDGGAGGFPSGGGAGGGSATNGSTRSGAGGKGGDGAVLVIEWT